MRLLEIKSLIEATTLIPSEIADRPDRLTLFLQKVTNQSPFQLTDGTSGVVDKKELPRLKKLFAAGDFKSVGKIKMADGRNLELGKFKKSAEFGGKTENVEGKINNRGEVSEGILGAGLFAKLSARAGGRINPIGPDDIWRVIDQLKNSGANEYSIKMRDAGKTVVNDSIVFILKLKEGAYLNLIDPAKRSLLTNEVNSVVEFSNSKDAEEYSKYFYLNGKPDIINVISDGVTNEKTSKIDVKVVVTDAKTGQQSERVLNLSLKAGADQFGQLGGGDAAKPGSQFESQKTLWTLFGIDVENLRSDYERLLKAKGLSEATAMMYINATSMFNELLSGDYDEEEYLYLKEFVKVINYFATLNVPNILLVSMEGGKYDVLNFDLLEDKLKDIDLGSRFSEETKNPQVEIIDKNTGEWLLRVRGKLEKQGTYLRHYIEKGPLLSKLISVKR